MPRQKLPESYITRTTERHGMRNQGTNTLHPASLRHEHIHALLHKTRFGSLKNQNAISFPEPAPRAIAHAPDNCLLVCSLRLKSSQA